MSLLVNLVSSSDGNDIGVGLIGSIPPFLCPLLYLEQIFLLSLVCILFLTVIATCNTFHFEKCWVDIGSLPPFLCPLLYLVVYLHS